MTQRLKRKSRAATQDEPEDVEEGARASRAKVAKRDKAPAKRERRESVRRCMWRHTRAT